MGAVINAFKQIFKPDDNYDLNAKDLHNKFINEMNNMDEDNNYIPKISSMDMKYNFYLQQQRLSRHNVSVKRKFIMKDNSVTLVTPLLGKDKRYVTRIPITNCLSEKSFVSNNKILKKEKSDGTISSYVVFAEEQDPKATYCCPNCGDINTVTQLLEQGCRSCGTKFMMPDLYPRITNYYTIRSKPYVRMKLFPFILIGIAAALLFFFLYSSKQLEPPASEYEVSMADFNYIFAMLATGVCGIFFGYLLYFIITMTLLLADGIGSSSRASAFRKFANKMPRFMQKYDPFFSVDFFVGKVNNLLKTMIFTDDYKNCSVYEKDGDNPYSDIIDIEYQGAVGLNKVYSDEQYIYADIDVYARTSRIKGLKLKQKNETFRMKLCRAIGVQDDCNASVSNIECRSCGASFNAVRERNCPYCRSPYNLRNYDWVVVDFEKR